MFTEPRVLLLAIGMIAGGYIFGILLWSIARPAHRIWPPYNVTAAIKFRVWFLAVLIFPAAFFLGVLDWNRFDWPASVRWGIGLPLILFGNIVVWRGVHKIGMAATSGEAAILKTNGLYSWSRNPQYVAMKLSITSASTATSPSAARMWGGEKRAGTLPQTTYSGYCQRSDPSPMGGFFQQYRSGPIH